MKKYSFLLSFLITWLGISAQEEPAEYKLVNQTQHYGISTLDLLDPYLSPLTYYGLGLGYETNCRQFFSLKNKNLSMVQDFSALLGSTGNMAGSSNTIYLGARYAWGTQYHYRINKELQLLGGGNVDANVGFKSNNRNVNNPANFDLSTNLNASLLIRYNYITRKKTYRYNLLAEAPVVGYMFVPQMGATYYEMFSVGNTSDAFHLSSLHNKQGLKIKYSIDIPFKKNTLSVGLSSNNLKYEANHMVFVYKTTQLHLGYTFDSYSFKGYNNKAPKNFANPNE